ncbi:glycosyl hydrolase family 8 [Bifidobacterium pseudocatenulatum]|uniref:glycosyl hydrolase family 8 n=1 Tax=Bifidobacterium pseudocatenulatum TaxID=28026 RepID=UPI0021F79450|nr:glycosyl hydrolase family 8 [Bifidobacterium pseudocatenulatum]
MGHMETSLFEQCGYSREAIQARLERNWYEMFEGPDKIYWENDEGLGYVMDTGNHDVRTEGMSYAMMIAVQYGRKDVFDKLWGWVMKYMFMTEGLHQGYFVWSVDPSGVPNADGPAPDGEEYFAMDLFLASARWGDGEGVYEYSRHVRSILHTCVHQGEDGEGYPMWNPENHLIKFIPETEWTDPSYHLPHFYEVFAELPFALTRYRVFNLPISMASGALVALEYGVYLMLFRYRGVSFLSPRGVIHMISELVGGVLIAGVMSWYLYRAIAATGALDRFASGRALRDDADRRG